MRTILIICVIITNMKDKSWYVYMVRCSDDTIYCGISVDIERRVKEHNSGKRGAKYTKSRRPVVLVYSEERGTVSDAMREERRIKSLKRSDKLKLIVDEVPEVANSILHRDVTELSD